MSATSTPAPSPSATSATLGQQPLQLGPNPYILLDTWIVLYAVAQVFLVLLIGTLVSRDWRASSARGRGGSKHTTLINMLFTMLLHTVVCSLLYYAGQEANPSPPYNLCLVQATLKHATGPMIITSEFCLALHLFLSIRARIRLTDDANVWIVRSLLISPYVVGFLWGIPVLPMGLMNRTKIHRLSNAYYCTLSNGLFGDLSTLFGVVLIIATAALLSSLARTLHKSWTQTHKLRASGSIDVSLVIRLSVFVVLQILYTIVTLVELVIKSTSPAELAIIYFSSILEALYPTAYFILFGLRQDTLEIWLTWCTPLLPKAFVSWLARSRSNSNNNSFTSSQISVTTSDVSDRAMTRGGGGEKTLGSRVPVPPIMMTRGSEDTEASADSEVEVDMEWSVRQGPLGAEVV